LVRTHDPRGHPSGVARDLPDVREYTLPEGVNDMKIVTFTIKAAFMDLHFLDPETVADQIVRYLSDGLNAEVCFTTSRDVEHVDYPDLSDELAEGEIEAWQEKAREIMEA
jgi:hypothetical protein